MRATYFRLINTLRAKRNKTIPWKCKDKLRWVMLSFRAGIKVARVVTLVLFYKLLKLYIEIGWAGKIIMNLLECNEYSQNSNKISSKIMTLSCPTFVEKPINKNNWEIFEFWNLKILEFEFLNYHILNFLFADFYFVNGYCLVKNYKVDRAQHTLL